MRRWAAAGLLALPLLLGGCFDSGGPDARIGVSRTAAGDVQLLYALCDGEKMTMIRAEELVGGNSGYAVPIYWQIESKGAKVPGPVTIGSVPAGWIETVRYRGGLPSEGLIGIAGTQKYGGMSFSRSALRENDVLRGTYDTVSVDRFYSDARDECGAMRRGALVAGLLGALLTTAALAALWRLHRQDPDGWRARAVRRGLIWLIALVTGSYWTLLVGSIRQYEVDLGVIVVVALLAAIPASLAGLTVLPIAVEIASRSRRFVPVRAEGWAAIGAAVTSGLVFWVLVCGRDWQWFPVCAAITLGLVAGIPASLMPFELPRARAAKVAVILAIAACYLVSGIGSVAFLSNSPSSPAWDLATFVPAKSLDVGQYSGSRVLRDERRAGSVEMRFDAVPGYELSVRCDDVSIQVSASLARESTEYYWREVVPCSKGTIAGPLAGKVRPGEQILLKVVAPPDVGWRLVAAVDD